MLYGSVMRQHNVWSIVGRRERDRVSGRGRERNVKERDASAREIAITDRRRNTNTGKSERYRTILYGKREI